MTEVGRCLRCDLRLLLSKPILAPKEELWVEFTSENVSQVPETEGVYQLLDEERNIIYIKGAMNLHRELEEQLEVYEKARYFMYEEEPMFTKRESVSTAVHCSIRSDARGESGARRPFLSGKI